jgi:hypothetical protein
MLDRLSNFVHEQSSMWATLLSTCLTGAHMVEVVALLFVFILSVGVALGAALVILGALLGMMSRTAVRPPSRSLRPSAPLVTRGAA